ncbi:MAG: hypothetical protein E1N59_2632 [Puniceicoccaceae bacterium 5H]|nr:MAG: hypothetical protein E1N59_2632 [Puniceicoccaceae bacterium 5H]
MTHLRILCEGQATEPQYFRALVAYLGLTQHVAVDCTESPDPQRLHAAVYQGDAPETWLVMDVEPHAGDAVRTRRLSKVIAQALEKGQPLLALSNPCFEYWLLLHEMEDPRALAKPDAIIARLEQFWQQPYRKSQLPLKRLIDSGRWLEAVDRSRRLRQEAGNLSTAGRLMKARPLCTVDALVERLVLFSGSASAADGPSGGPQ